MKHAQSPNSDSRASASASLASSSQAAECSTSSGTSGNSPADGASCCTGSSNGSNHTGTCSETNGLYDGEHQLVFLSQCRCALKHMQVKIFIFCSGEEEAMDHQVSPEPENGHSEEEEEASDLENRSKADATKSCSLPSKLFTFSVVNSYGTANISSLPCDGNILQLNREHSLCKPFTSVFFLWLTRSLALALAVPLQPILLWPSTGTQSQRSCIMTSRRLRWGMESTHQTVHSGSNSLLIFV